MEHPENNCKYKGLQVNEGVNSQPVVNPYLGKRRVAKKRLSVNDYVDGIIKGDVSVLGRAVTLIESVAESHQSIAQEVIEKCLPYSGKSRRIGITGVPGAGKSTSIDVFGLHVLRKGGKLAVLAIDPSSERTKGSILGDKTRMEKLSQQKDAFIRPSLLPAVLAVWHVKPEKRLFCARLQVMIIYLSRQLVLDKVKQLFTQWWISFCLYNLPEPEMSYKA